MEIWHLRFSSEGRHPLFPTEGQRRAAVTVVVQRAGPYLITFGIVDDHLHIVLVCDRATAGKLSRALLLGLRPIARREFESPYIKPVENRSHLLRLVGYTIEQPAKHGLDTHPALWSGSAFPDIVGARVICRLRISDVLPRYRTAEAWKAAGLSPQGVSPLEVGLLRSADVEALTVAASFVANAPPELSGRTAPETRARALVVSLAREAGLPTHDVTVALDISREAARKLSKRPVEDHDLEAVLLRMRIEMAVARRA